MYRVANFFISKNLDKAEKMPNYRHWKVSESDRCVEGPILLYIRAKGWFFDRVGQLGMRYCVLTKRGFLMIYMHDEKGFVLDMRRAFEVATVSDNVSLARKNNYRRCRVKIRYSFGTVNIILTNAKIDLWRDRLLNATAAAKSVVTRPLALPQLPVDHDCTTAASPASSTAHVEISPSLVALKSFSAGGSDREASKRDNWARVKTPARFLSSASELTALDVSSCSSSEDDDQYLAARLADDEAPSVAETSTSGLFHYNSIRESTVSVGKLRRQLEHKIITDRRRVIAAAPPTTTPVSTMRPSEAEPTPSPPGRIETSISTAPKHTKHVKISKKRMSPMRASAKSVPSDSSSCEENRYNSFQFWRSSIFESDV